MGLPSVTPFPVIDWPEMGVTATFLPHTFRPNVESTAVVVFAWTGESFRLANIIGRGWCTPSGQIDLGESPSEAAIREVQEETGAIVDNLIPLGCFRFVRPDSTVYFTPTYVASLWGDSGQADPKEVREVRDFYAREIPEAYYRWDPLLAAVFWLAEEVARAKFSSLESSP